MPVPEDMPDHSELKHSQGGTTTRDALDKGVPMLQGDGSEPVGPEDALGPGPKRGDYTGRVKGNPHSGSTPQLPNVSNVGDTNGKKGGVDSVDPA